MPELPEVETIRTALAPRLIGARIARARLIRRDVAVAPGDPAGGFSRQRATNGRAPAPPAPVRPAHLLRGDRIANLDRRGKRLLIRAESGRSVGVHLGMTGQLLVLPPRQPLPDHAHAVWWWTPPPPVPPPPRGGAARRLSDTSAPANGARGSGTRAVGIAPGMPGSASGLRPPGVGLPGPRLVFRDPRRFGGLWLFPDAASADAWLDQLGPDALTITARQLARALAGAHRPIKAALLDQSLLAGVGNIYADEALYRAHLLPQRSAAGLGRDEIADLARAMRVVLREAIRSRGSTLRDYRDPEGRAGAAQLAHQVYGRAGAPCLRCRRPLTLTRVAQRATVLCGSCQG